MTIDRSQARETSLIVQLRQGTSSTGSLAAYSVGGTLGEAWQVAPGFREVELKPGTNLDAARRAYAADPNVLSVEPDYRISVNWTPNDPDYATEQWSLHNTGQTGGIAGSDIHAPEAWNVTRGSPSVVVAVIDSGVDYTHPDLAPNMWVNSGETPSNGIDDDHDGFVDDVYGYDFVNNDGDPMDDYFHGTHVAGTIAAVADNGLGIAGVAPHARLMALKFLDDQGNGFTSDAIKALNFAVTHGATISNNSWGVSDFSAAFQTAIQNAAAQGHIFVASAGNNGLNTDDAPQYPADYNASNIVSVAATDRGDYLAWFSNYGKRTVDIAAPGVDIYSTLPTHETSGMASEGVFPNYGTLSGTSMAAPHVAGVLALLRSQNPGWTWQQLVAKIYTTVDREPSLANTTLSGGRINAATALGVAPVDASLPRIVQADPTGNAAAGLDHVRLTFNKPIAPASFDIGQVSFTAPDSSLIPITGVASASDDNTQFDVAFDPLVLLGRYTLTIHPHMQDLSGHELDQDRDGQGGLDGLDDYTLNLTLTDGAGAAGAIFSAADVPVGLEGDLAIASYIIVDQDLPITDLTVRLNISFPQDGSLSIWLVSPAGTIVRLSDQHGDDNADFQDTLFDDSAATPIGDGAAPFAGSFQPDDPLSALAGQSALGVWTLYVQNIAATDRSGTLNRWSLEINGGASTGDGDGGDGDGGEDHVNQPPVAGDDTISVVQNTPYYFDGFTLLANDSDPDGDPLTLVDVRSAVGGTVSLIGNRAIRFTPTMGGLAPGSFQYVISDGSTTAIGTVRVVFKPQYPWHNLSNGVDVNADGYVSPIDALLVINWINVHGAGGVAGAHAAAAAIWYYDVIPDNQINPTDALTVINYINANPSAGALALSLAPVQAPPAEGEAQDDLRLLAIVSLADDILHDAASGDVAPDIAAPDIAALDPAAIDHCLTAGVGIDNSLLFDLPARFRRQPILPRAKQPDSIGGNALRALVSPAPAVAR
ncbi:MAG: S8 family serine peptidase [Pirellulales bacterium]|nr:S8 family serine peptidase [Pirellulales bacterium]